MSIIEFPKDVEILKNVSKLKEIMKKLNQDLQDLPEDLPGQILAMSITKNDIDFANSIRDTLLMIPKEEKRTYGGMLVAILARHIGATISSFAESDLDADIMLNTCNNYIFKQLTKGETYE